VDPTSLDRHVKSGLNFGSMAKKQSQRQLVDAALVQRKAVEALGEPVLDAARAKKPLERVYFRGALVRRKP